MNIKKYTDTLSKKVSQLKEKLKNRPSHTKISSNIYIVLMLFAVVGLLSSVYAIQNYSTSLFSRAYQRDDSRTGSQRTAERSQGTERGVRERTDTRGDHSQNPNPSTNPDNSNPSDPSTPPSDTGGNTGDSENTGSKPSGEGQQPYAGAPKCDESLHNPTEWHALWNYDEGCHYDHEHKMNPHDLDDVFGTDIYQWAGGSLSYPWQTYAGAGVNFESYANGTCTENSCKHEGYKWLTFKDRTSTDSITGALLLGAHAITDARVQYHGVGGELGALTRVHSVWLEARACYNGQISDETCGIYKGGGWLDLGRLNYPARGDYQPLPGDPAAFSDKPAQLAPYRIHATGKNSLDSWQSEGNVYNYLSTDPQGLFRLRVGYGVHFLQGESVGETNPLNAGIAPTGRSTHFWCLDPETNVYTCNNNNSAAALFRTWVSIPKNLDGSVYDEDKTKDGYFTFHGYTNRYGDIVENCTSPGLDCVPAIAEHFPVGGCNNPTGICKAAYRGGADQDGFDADISPEGEWWIEYPN